MIEIKINEDVRVEILSRHCYPVRIVCSNKDEMYLAFQELTAIAAAVAQYLSAAEREEVEFTEQGNVWMPWGRVGISDD